METAAITLSLPSEVSTSLSAGPTRPFSIPMGSLSIMVLLAPDWERILASATECPRIRASFLAEERRTMGERWFRQEYLCEFEDTVSSVFGRDLVQQALTDEVAPLVL